MPNEDTLYSAKHWAAKAKEYAEQAHADQIQSDFEQSDNSKVDFIKNKPTKLSDFTDDTASNPVSRATADASGNNIENTYATKSGSNTFTGTNTFNGVLRKTLDVVLGTQPTTRKDASFDVFDNNGTFVGGLTHYYDTSGVQGKYMSVRKQDGSENYAIFGIGYDSSQNEFVSASAGVMAGIVNWVMPGYFARGRDNLTSGVWNYADKDVLVTVNIGPGLQGGIFISPDGGVSAAQAIRCVAPSSGGYSGCSAFIRKGLYYQALSNHEAYVDYLMGE